MLGKVYWEDWFTVRVSVWLQCESVDETEFQGHCEGCMTSMVMVRVQSQGPGLGLG